MSFTKKVGSLIRSISTIMTSKRLVIGELVKFYKNDLIYVGAVIGLRRNIVYVDVENKGLFKVKRRDIIFE